MSHSTNPILFLSATLHFFRKEHMEFKISLSSAIAALCACLVSLVFGITLGRAWSYVEAKSQTADKDRDTLSVDIIPERKRVIKSKIVHSVSESGVSAFTAPSLDIPMTPPRARSKDKDDETDTPIIFEAAEAAKSSLLAVLDVSTNASKNSVDVTLRNWKLARTGFSSHMWIAKNKTPNILIKGTCFASLPVVKYLFQSGISTGPEGTVGERETLRTLRRNRVVVSRLS
jgi:hypothetical protein